MSSDEKSPPVGPPDYDSMGDDPVVSAAFEEQLRQQDEMLRQTIGREYFDGQGTAPPAVFMPTDDWDAHVLDHLQYIEEVQVAQHGVQRYFNDIQQGILKVVMWLGIVFIIAILGIGSIAEYQMYQMKNMSKYRGTIKAPLVARQAYSYGGEHPTITITGGLPSATSHWGTTVTDHLTVTSTVPVTVSTVVAETTSIGLNVSETSSIVSESTQTQVFNTTAFQTETVTAGRNVTITETATGTSEGTAIVTPFVPGPHSWPNSTVSITHFVPMSSGTSVSHTTENTTVTSDVDTTVPFTTTVNITVTLSPIPLWTTGGSDAATGSVLNTTSFGASVTGHSGHSTVPTVTVSNSSSQIVNATSTRGTIYTTVTETISPSSDNCTHGASETVHSTAGSDAMTASRSATSSSAVSLKTVTVVIPASTAVTSNTFTSTETETITPVYTVEMTKSVTETEGDNSISVYTVTSMNVNTITVTLARSSSTTSTSSEEFCSAHETETVTVVSTVWGVPTSTSTSSAVPVSTETVSIGSNTTMTGQETTIISTATVNGTLTRTTGGAAGITASPPYANSSTVVIPCNSTDMYTVTVLPAASNPAVTTTASTEGPGVIISTIITTITTGSLHAHSISDVSTSTAMFNPMSVNATGLTPPLVNGTGMGNITAESMTSGASNGRPESLPVGPAGINSTEPMNMNMTMNGTMTMSMSMTPSMTHTHTQSIATTTAASSARRQFALPLGMSIGQSLDNDDDDLMGKGHCIVMVIALLGMFNIW